MFVYHRGQVCLFPGTDPGGTPQELRRDIHSVIRFVFPSVLRIAQWLTSPSLLFSYALPIVVAETKVACVYCQNSPEGEKLWSFEVILSGCLSFSEWETEPHKAEHLEQVHMDSRWTCDFKSQCIFL